MQSSITRRPNNLRLRQASNSSSISATTATDHDDGWTKTKYLYGVVTRTTFSRTSKIGILILASVLTIIMAYRTMDEYSVYDDYYNVELKQALDETFGESNTFTFPTVEERIQIYMGKWYDRSDIVTTSDNNDNESIQNAVCAKLVYGGNVSAKEMSDKDILYSLAGLEAEVAAERLRLAKQYLAEALSIIDGALTDYDAAEISSRGEGNLRTKIIEESSLINRNDGNVAGNSIVESSSIMREEVFIILRAGDDSTSHSDLPVVAKTRYLPISPTNIVWPLNIVRHFTPVDKYRTLEKMPRWSPIRVTPWEKKESKLIWRGAVTGMHSPGRIFEKGDRVHVVTTYFNDDREKIDVAFRWTRSIPPEYKQYVKRKLWMSTLLSYKYILSLPGNDVASGLKWQLASNSVVFMAKPKTMSYAMEHLLVPFVHYVPVKDDYSNLMEMVEWARANDDKCKWISHQATEYMNRLYGTEQADRENKLVARGLVNRYIAQFSPTLKSCAP